MPDSPTFDSFVVDTHLKTNLNQQSSNNSSTASNQQSSSSTSTARLVNSPDDAAHAPPARQKSLELIMDSLTISEAKQMQKQPAQASVSTGPAFGESLQPGSAIKLEKRSNSVTCCVPSSSLSHAPSATSGGVSAAAAESASTATVPISSDAVQNDADRQDIPQNRLSPAPVSPNAANSSSGGPGTSKSSTSSIRQGEGSSTTARPSISNENNILLDPEVLTDQVTQVLVLTVMATLVKYTTTESEVRILYEYLAEASVVFPKVFPIIHSLLDAKITNVLNLCHDKTILASVQAIIENMIACEKGEEDKMQQQLHYLQSCGFGGLWRFAGPFPKANCNNQNVELFVNTLEALVETCLPVDDPEEVSNYDSLLSCFVKQC